MRKAGRHQFHKIHQAQFCGAVTKQMFSRRVHVFKVSCQIERKENLGLLDGVDMALFTISFVSHISLGSRTERDCTRVLRGTQNRRISKASRGKKTGSAKRDRLLHSTSARCCGNG